MQIKIHQNWRGDYQLFKNDEETPLASAKWKGGLFSRKVCLIKDNNKSVIAKLQIGFSAWIWSRKKSTFILEFTSSDISVEYKIESYVKGFWSFIYRGEEYQLHSHRGHKKSLFDSERQVAKFDKRKGNIGHSDKMTITCNSSLNPLVLFGLFLAWDFGEDRDTEFTFDLGRMTNGLKEYDESWRPTE